MIHREPSEGQSCEARIPYGLVLLDLESGGRRFDSRLPEGRLGVTFCEFRMSWDVSGSGLATFSDGFGMVSQKNVGRVIQIKSSKMAGSIFMSGAD